MKPLTSRALTVVLSAALVVIGLELTSYAANGHALLLGQAKHLEARNLVAPVLERFTEGFGTLDLIEAKALLQTVDSAHRSV